MFAVWPTAGREGQPDPRTSKVILRGEPALLIIVPSVKNRHHDETRKANTPVAN